MNEYELKFLEGNGIGYVHADSFVLVDGTAIFFIEGRLIYTAEDVFSVVKVHDEKAVSIF